MGSLHHPGPAEISRALAGLAAAVGTLWLVGELADLLAGLV
ncbi:hypothetical protein [Miltoncostaea oceani]|nr:hypothetical protein [Miltoncostaea oceani]